MAHVKRWLTALIAIPILLYIIGFGPRWLFLLLLLFASCVSLHEFFSLTSPKLPWVPRAVAFLLCFCFLAVLSQGPISQCLAVLCLSIMVALTLYLFSPQDLRKHVIEDVGRVSLGFLYIVLPIFLLALVDRAPRGNVWIFFLLTVIFLGDTGAMYCGRLLGKHKLYVSVSPGKTWEGAVGGFLTSVGAGLLFARIFDLHGSSATIAAISGVLSIMGQIGDLAESVIKRNCGVKDSGGILPGHGGFLDRVDALLFAIPVFYAFMAW